MTCSHCEKTLEPDSAYCRHCGASVGATGEPRRLTPRPDDGRIGGVCAGMADYFNTDVTLVRAASVVLAIVPGILSGELFGYLVAWVLMPSAPCAGASTGKRLRRSNTDRKIGGVCGSLAEYLGADATPVLLAWAILTVVPLAVIPGRIICGVLAYLSAWFIVLANQAAAPTVGSS